jgi:hypothetical protein
MRSAGIAPYRLLMRVQRMASHVHLCQDVSRLPQVRSPQRFLDTIVAEASRHATFLQPVQDVFVTGALPEDCNGVTAVVLLRQMERGCVLVCGGHRARASYGPRPAAYYDPDSSPGR